VNAICLSIPLEDDVALPPLLERISSKNPNLVEYRLDHLSDRSILDIVAAAKTCKIIATDRLGRDPASGILFDAVKAGFDYVDIDVSIASVDTIRKLKNLGSGVIVSHHNLTGTPSEERLFSILRSEMNLGGDICKLVTKATRPNDNLTLLKFVGDNSQRTRLVSFAIGKLGIPSRVLSPTFGAEFTFASLDNQSTTAEGQLSIDNLRNVWRILGLS
jgi:3-dehydroquinate dehydratase